MTESKRPDAPSSRSFTTLIAALDKHLAFDHAIQATMIGDDHVRDLVACIREQQAALSAICNTWGEPADKPGPSLTDLVEEGRATLAKWRIE